MAMWIAIKSQRKCCIRKRLCAKNKWPIIDVTRRSIEETAATIIKLYHDREAREAEAAVGEAGGNVDGA